MATCLQGCKAQLQKLSRKLQLAAFYIDTKVKWNLRPESGRALYPPKESPENAQCVSYVGMYYSGSTDLGEWVYDFKLLDRDVNSGADFTGSITDACVMRIGRKPQ